jgi:hypothetical protein
MTPGDPSPKTAPHEHEFTALWWHFGPYKRQDVHIHSCFTEGCDVAAVGLERSCTAETTHWWETLSAEHPEDECPPRSDLHVCTDYRIKTEGGSDARPVI